MKEIKLHENSKKYLSNVFKDYKEVKEYTSHNGTTVIHMYPKYDTWDLNTDELEGYIDAMLCEVHIYNLTDMTVYKSKYHDAIYFTNISVSTKVFKDFSTMITINKPNVNIIMGKAITFYVGKY